MPVALPPPGAPRPTLPDPPRQMLHRVGALAKGPGAEAPLAFFQQNVCDYLGPETRAPSATRPPGSAASLHEAARPEGAR